MASRLGAFTQRGSAPRCSSSSVGRQLLPVLRAATARPYVHRRFRATTDTIAAPPSEAGTFSFSRTFDLSIGQLLVEPVSEADVGGASMLLTRAFAGSLEAIALKDATLYIEGMLHKSPKGIFLVARLIPRDKTLLGPNKTCRLVGTAALSLHADTMLPCLTLTPPLDGGYLSNMAVDPKLRRSGIANSLLEAADAVTIVAAPHLNSIYLHVCAADVGPVRLYTGKGYTEVDRDGPLVQFAMGMRPRMLMCKALA